MMKKGLLLLSVPMLFTLQLSAQQPTKKTTKKSTAPAVEVKKENPIVLKSYNDSVSYAIGVDIAQNMLQLNIENDINPDVLSAGFKSGFTKSGYVISPEQSQMITQAFFMKMQQKKQTDESAKFAVNIEIGKKFLEENKKNPEIITTASGLQYRVITKGKGGKTPKTNDQVTVHYEGKLLNGKVFDSSIQRGEPVTFGVSQVIPGFSEALQLMTPGTKLVVYIPQELAYKEANMGQIEPYSTLIFDLELISIAEQSSEVENAVPSTEGSDKKEKKAKKEKK